MKRLKMPLFQLGLAALALEVTHVLDPWATAGVSASFLAAVVIAYLFAWLST